MLEHNRVQKHPFVIGKLARGSLPDRQCTLILLSQLPTVRVASDKEVLYFIEQHALMSRGVGYIDMHLLASAALDASKLLTRDKRLHTVAEALSLAQYREH